MNPIKIIKYQLYLLQLENYELERYWKLLFKKGLWPKGDQRKNLVWTIKARALLVMAIGLHIIIPLAILVLSSKYQAVSLLLFLALFTCYVPLFTIALVLLWPLDFLAKSIVIARAKSKILNLKSQIKIIGVAGSYGKTTTKEVLREVLGVRFKVLATPESVNTPVGIARFILNTVNEQTQVLILELGEHYRGDIKEICDIASPDISVITGINEAHFERMGSLDNIAATIFEAVEYAKPHALLVLNGDDENVIKGYQKFVKARQKVEKYRISNFNFQKFNQEKLCWEAESEYLGKVEIGLLGEYALGDVAAAIIAAKELGLSAQEIKMGLLNIKPVEHRLEPIRSAGDVLVIDDSYNGNPEGAAEAIRVLSRFANRRKIYITPGLVEMGRAAPEVHRKIGRELAGVADVVILIKDSVTSYIAEGIRGSNGGEKPQIIWFNTAQEAHEGLKAIIKPGDVVLFQNDWGDQYV